MRHSNLYKQVQNKQNWAILLYRFGCEHLAPYLQELGMRKYEKSTEVLHHLEQQATREENKRPSFLDTCGIGLEEFK